MRTSDVEGWRAMRPAVVLGVPGAVVRGWVTILAMLALVGLWPAVPTAAADASPQASASALVGAPAPAFTLPRVDGAGQVASDTLFEAWGLTLLAFWTTHCAECTRRMEVVQELHDWGREAGFQAVGVNFDDSPSAKMKLVAESAGPRLLHVYDPAGRMAAVYEAGGHSYSAFLVDGRGIVRAVYYEIMPDQLQALQPRIEALLEEALSGGPEGVGAGEPVVRRPGEMPPYGRPGILEELALVKQQRLELHGRGRLRWMHVDTTGTGAVGANGEPLVPGPSLRHRMDLELSYAITPDVRAGGLIRLSNEGDLVLRGGPDYLSNPWGSFFLRYDDRWRLPILGQVASSLIGGYYRVHFTPLTLMRWDQEDTPVSGGQRAQGCGVCGGEAVGAGFIRSESLEQMSPDLMFEGARWNLVFGRFDLLALYARPQTSYPDDPEACYTSDPEQNYFHQDLYGGRLKSHWPVAWGSAPLELAGTFVYTNDQQNLPGCPNIYMHDRAFPISDRVLGADLFVPLPAFTTVWAELASSTYDPNKYNNLSCCSADRRLEGSAALAGISKEFRAGSGGTLFGWSTRELMARVELAWMRVSEEFFSAYNALSYEANQSGVRGSVRADWGPAGVGFFIKRLTPLEEFASPCPAVERDQRRLTTSLWLDAELWSGGVVMLGGVFEDRDIYQDIHISPSVPTSERLGPLETTTLIASFEQEIAPKCSLIGELEWLDGSYVEGVSNNGVICEESHDYQSTVVRLMMDVEF